MTPELILIPGGEFWMGQEDGRDDERPVHRVCVAPFLLARYQVTNAEWDCFRLATGGIPPPHRFSDPMQPVVAVSWHDAVGYCEWLGRGFRLPTEAEWEFAARGGVDGQPFPWGNEIYSDGENYFRRWIDGPEPVGTSTPNPYGLHDMCENVHEWCLDWYDPGYYSVSPADNPTGPDSGLRKASRGGAWRHHIKVSRCAARSSIPPEFRYADYGFRVAMSVV